MSKKPKVSIVDYGVGNLRSLIIVFNHFGCEVTIVAEPDRLISSEAIVLPGDGAFKAGMDGLAVRNLTSAVLDFAERQKPILGICLGAQILLSEGYEFGLCKGLNLIEGKVVKFPNILKGAKVPQIGWNEIVKNPKKSSYGIFNGIKNGDDFYFIHSYIMKPKNKRNILATTNYGGISFASMIGNKDIYGCQFHPEKSARAGLKIIQNFVELLP